jgi:hypothetical protein
VFEIALGFMVSTENRELAFMAATEDRERVATEATRKREEEWLKRVGTPARLELNVDEAGVGAAMTSVVEAVKAMRPGSDYTIMIYYGSEGGKESAISNEALENLFGTVLELLKRGAIREYKRIICFDHDVLENDQSLKSGVLRVGEGPGTISRLMGDHCRVMMKTKGCYLYVAPVVLRSFVGLYGVDKASITLEIVDQSPGGRRIAGVMLFSDRTARLSSSFDRSSAPRKDAWSESTRFASPKNWLPQRIGQLVELFAASSGRFARRPMPSAADAAIWRLTMTDTDAMPTLTTSTARAYDRYCGGGSISLAT